MRTVFIALEVHEQINDSESVTILKERIGRNIGMFPIFGNIEDAINYVKPKNCHLIAINFTKGYMETLLAPNYKYTKMFESAMEV